MSATSLMDVTVQTCKVALLSLLSVESRETGTVTKAWSLEHTYATTSKAVDMKKRLDVFSSAKSKS